LKIDHPCFFHSFCSTRGGGDSLLADGPSSPSDSAGTFSGLPDELCASLTSGISHYNKLGPSSIADISRTPFRTTGSTPLPKTKKASDPCIPSEAMVKINYLLELLDLQSSSCKPEVAASGFPFDPPKKVDTTIVQGMKRKISPSDPYIRPVVDRPLLSALCCLHMLIFTDEVTAELTGGCIRE